MSRAAAAGLTPRQRASAISTVKSLIHRRQRGVNGKAALAAARRHVATLERKGRI